MGYLDNNGVAYLYSKIKEYIAVQKPYSIAVGNGEPYSVWKGTYAEYCAITPDESTIYIITTPPYDAEIEYLENSTGKEAIDTGIYGTNTTQVSFETMFFNTEVPDYTGGDAFGSGVVEYGKTQNVLGITYNREQDNLYSFLGKNYKVIQGLNLLTGIKHTITYSSKGTWVNGVKRQNGWYNNSFQTPYTIAAMTMRTVSGIFGGSRKARLYNFSISDNGILVRDFIPVRVGNVGYLFDKVSMKLFGNAGTGSFILGADKN